MFKLFAVFLESFVLVLVAKLSDSLATTWIVALQSPLSMGFSRQEYWRGFPCPPPGGSSWSKDQTWVSHIAGRFFTTEQSGSIEYCYPNGMFFHVKDTQHRASSAPSPPSLIQTMLSLPAGQVPGAVFRKRRTSQASPSSVSGRLKQICAPGDPGG